MIDVKRRERALPVANGEPLDAVGGRGLARSQITSGRTRRLLTSTCSKGGARSRPTSAAAFAIRAALPVLLILLTPPPPCLTVAIAALVALAALGVVGARRRPRSAPSFAGGLARRRSRRRMASKPTLRLFAIEPIQIQLQDAGDRPINLGVSLVREPQNDRGQCRIVPMLTHEPPRVPKPASKNPWYVLATIHGEQTEEGWNEEVAAKNRRIWNGWSCGHLPKAKRAELAKLAKLDEAALEAWSETERAEVEKVFATGRGMGMTLPDPEAGSRFQGHAFRDAAEHVSVRVQPRRLCSPPPSSTGMRGSTAPLFSGDAWFGSATFSGDAWFGNARFSRYAWFDHATFSGDARFSSATVSGDAVFNGATFGGDAWFDGARFSGYAWFDSATLSGDAWFDSANVQRGRLVRQRHVRAFRQFHGRDLREDCGVLRLSVRPNDQLSRGAVSGRLSAVFRRDPPPEHHLHRQRSVLACHEQRRARGQS